MCREVYPVKVVVVGWRRSRVWSDQGGGGVVVS